jgi:hypothetical protein
MGWGGHHEAGQSRAVIAARYTFVLSLLLSLKSQPLISRFHIRAMSVFEFLRGRNFVIPTSVFF